MDHIAIMSAKTSFLARVATGEKVIESRWYRYKRPPWNKIHVGDRVYFKNSGQAVSLMATVAHVEQYAELDAEQVACLVEKNAKALGIHSHEIPVFVDSQKTKRFAIFVFLQSIQAVEPFLIDKTGFGAMSAWITVENVKTLARRSEEG